MNREDLTIQVTRFFFFIFWRFPLSMSSFLKPDVQKSPVARKQLNAEKMTKQILFVTKCSSNATINTFYS